MAPTIETRRWGPTRIVRSIRFRSARLAARVQGSLEAAWNGLAAGVQGPLEAARNGLAARVQRPLEAAWSGFQRKRALRTYGLRPPRAPGAWRLSLSSPDADVNGSPFMHYRLGQVLKFATDQNGPPFLRRGWSYPEPWGTWTQGWMDSRVGEVVLDLAQPCSSDLILYVRLTIPSAVSARLNGVIVRVNGWDVAFSTVTDLVHEIYADLPLALVEDATRLEIVFEATGYLTVTRPSGEIERILGVGLLELAVARAN